MAVNQERGSGGEAGRHSLGVARVELDQDEALPVGTGAFDFRLQFVQEGFLELEDGLHVHAGNEGLGGGGGGIGEDDVFEIVGAGGNDGGALVDLGGIEQVEDGEVLDLENLVHTLDAEAAFSIEEIGDVGLFETGLLGKAESGEFTCCDTVAKDFSKIVLQGLELH